VSVWEVNYLLARLTVAEVMTPAVVTVGAERDIATAAHRMLEHRIDALPVVADGRLLGIITETNLVRALLHTQESSGHPPVRRSG
jgi:acetoin utilization protein AcuB